MSTCDRCGRNIDSLPYSSLISLCTLCSSIERERQEDLEREEEAQAERLEQSRENAERARENAERVAEARANPGDYDCPACRYRTLRYCASRCPKCQANVDNEYWLRVIAKEKAAKAKWESEAPARARKAREDAEKAREDAERREKKAREDAERAARAIATARHGDLSYMFAVWYFIYFLPILCYITQLYIFLGSIDAILRALDRSIFMVLELLFLLVPFANWLLVLIGLSYPNAQPVILECLLCWAAAGVAFTYLIKKL